MNNPHEFKVEGYVEPTQAELAARKRRNYAVGGLLAGFCVLVFVLMVFKIKSMGLDIAS